MQGIPAERIELQSIARVHTPFGEKFGVPRQAGLVPEAKGTVVFEPAFRNPDIVRGLEGFSHIWLIWCFHRAQRDNWSPTVRPPRLGGNTRLGVFATRSPFRPNPIGLSCVKLEGVERDPKLGPLLHISGMDMVDGTPILDIKPYVPYCDIRGEATGGFTADLEESGLSVEIPPMISETISADFREGLVGVLAQDPRPRYQDDPDRIYGMAYGGVNVKFRVEGNTVFVVGVEG